MGVLRVQAFQPLSDEDEVSRDEFLQDGLDGGSERVVAAQEGRLIG